MDTSKLLPLEKRSQIITAIERAAPFGGDLWQTTQSGRQVLQIIQMHIDVKYDKVILRTYGLIEVDPGLPLYLRLCYRNLIFKLDPGQYKVLGDKIIFEYPNEVHGLKVRKGERYVLPVSSNISLSIKRNIRSLKETVFELEVRIVDVSEYGFGILISGNNRDFLRQFEHCWIKTVDHRPLGHPLHGMVTYVAPKGYYLRRGEVRVGLSLEAALSNELFEHLKKKCRLVLGA